jgi:peptide/nickel transport system permease protein
MGLDHPVLIQYKKFLGRVVFHGNFGQSFVYKVPALQLILEKFPATFRLIVLEKLFLVCI